MFLPTKGLPAPLRHKSLWRSSLRRHATAASVACSSSVARTDVCVTENVFVWRIGIVPNVVIARAAGAIVLDAWERLGTVLSKAAVSPQVN